MCGRYELHTHPAAIALAFELAHASSYEPSYNIAPMTDVPVVRVNANGERELVRMRWGFVPRWAKDTSIGNRMINARGETLADKPFGLAGLFERWLSPDGEVLDTCTIVTTDANALLAPVHDRMPLIIAPEQYARWLDPHEDDVRDLVVPFPAERMTHYPISTRVNNVRHDDDKIIEYAEPVTVAAHEP